MSTELAIKDRLDTLLGWCDLMSKSGLVPKSFKTKEQIFAATQYGESIGLTWQQSLNSLMVVNGKVSLTGQATLGKIQASVQLEWMKEEQVLDAEKKPCGIRVTMKRKGQQEPFVGEFTVAHATRAGLMGKDTYQGYTRDMLYWRAVSRAARGFSDITGGLTVAEDAPATTTIEYTAAASDPLLLENTETIIAPTGEVVERVHDPLMEEPVNG